MSDKKPPKVFISYSQDSESFKKAVLDFSNKLRSEGVETILDQYIGNPPEGWPRWMENNILDSDYVLAIASEEYYKKARGLTSAGVGRGAKWESNLLYQLLYENDTLNEKTIPIIFKNEDIQFIPLPIKGNTRYNVRNDKEYDTLYWRLHGVDINNVAPPVGIKRPMPVVDADKGSMTQANENKKPPVGNNTPAPKVESKPKKNDTAKAQPIGEPRTTPASMIVEIARSDSIPERMIDKSKIGATHVDEYTQEQYMSDLRIGISRFSNIQLVQWLWLLVVRYSPFVISKINERYSNDIVQKYLITMFYTIDVCSGITPIGNNVLDLIRDLDLYRALDLYRDRAVNRALAYDLDRDFEFARALDLALDLTRTLDLSYDRDRAVNLDRTLDLILFRKLLIDDVKAIALGRYEEINNDTSVYGHYWNAFHKTLKECDCGYWSDIYTDLWNSCFKTDITELKCRLQLPLAYLKKGAAEAAKWLIEQESKRH